MNWWNGDRSEERTDSDQTTPASGDIGNGAAADIAPVAAIRATGVSEPDDTVTRYCDGLIEAGWLIALVVVPLLFNIYSKQVFEPDKATILRMLAFVQALAWVVKATASRQAWRREMHRIRRFPLLLPITAILFSYVLSSFFSVAPRLSWLGSYERREGTLTLLACLLIFVMTATHLRSRLQLGRLVFTVLLTSVPVSAYGVAQFFDVDPLPWGDYFRSQAGLRVTSTLGNPIFLGAFLLLPSFLTLGWFLQQWVDPKHSSTEPRRTAHRMLLLLAILLTLAIQLLALFLTSSRGPLLGWVAGLYLLLLAGSLSVRTTLLRKEHPRLAALSLAAGAALLVAGAAAPVALAAWNAAPRGEIIGETSRLERLLRLDSPTARVRTLIWETVARILSAEKPLTFPDGSRDAFHPLRQWIGYGPETFMHAFAREYPAELGKYEQRRARPDRAHSEPLQVLVTRGWLGLLAYVFLLTEILSKSARWLGLTSSHREETILRVLLLTTPLLAAAAFWFLTPAFLGFGVVWGLLLAFAAWCCFVVRPTDWRIGPSAWFLLACLAALVAHCGETQTGFPITASSLYFWVVCAVLVASGEHPEILKTNPTMHHSRRAGQRAGLGSGLLVSLALVTLCFDFVGNWDRSDSAVARVLQWLTGNSVLHWPGTLPNLFLILLLTWSVGAMLFQSFAELSTRGSGWRDGFTAFLVFALFSVAPAYLFLSTQTLFPAAVRILPQIVDIERQLLFQYSQIQLVMLALAAFWVLEGSTLSDTGAVPVGKGLRSLRRTLLTVGVCATVAAWIAVQGMRTIRADVLVKQAEGLAAVGRNDLSRAYLEELSLLRPSEDHYWTVKGTLELKWAGQLSDRDGKRHLYERSRESLEAAQRLDPLSVTAAENLAVLYRTRAMDTGEALDRLPSLEKAREYLQQALNLSPNLAYLHNELGALWMASGDHERARLAYERSLELDDSYQATYLALGILERLQAEISVQRGDSESARVRYIEAVVYYESLLRLNPQSVEAHSALAFLRWQLGQEEISVRHHEEVLRLQPRNLRSHRRLAEIYFGQGRFGDSLRHVRLGLEIAPADPALKELNLKLSAYPDLR